MLKLLHTSDWQLGKPFTRGFAPDAAQRLADRRLDVIERLAALARERAVDLVIVAGDLFDDRDVTDDVILRARDRMLRFGSIPIVVVPGNHDAAGGERSVWKRDVLRRHALPGLRILTTTAPCLVERPADAPVVILPAPLASRQVFEDPTAAMTREAGRELAPTAYRIGIAHGSVQSFGQAAVPNLIAADRAQQAELDYLALGDWHGQRRIDSRTWYSGTPEPTSFKELAGSPGKALIVSIAAPGAEPEVESVPVATTIWRTQKHSCMNERHVEALESAFRELPQPQDTVLALELDGLLDIHTSARLDRVLADARARLLHLSVARRGLHIRPSTHELDDLAATGFVADAVRELVERDRAGGIDAATARESLRLLHAVALSVAGNDGGAA